MVSSAGLEMEVDDVDLQASAEELLSKTPEQDRAATKRAVDDFLGLHAAKKVKKESATLIAGVAGAAVAVSLRGPRRKRT